MTTTFKSAPEYASVAAFVEYCFDDERSTFNHEDLTALSYRTRTSTQPLRAELESWGLTITRREPARSARGYKTSSHDRWFGPGSCPTHGGCSSF